MDFPRIWASLCFIFLLRFLKYVLILLNNSEQSPTQVTTIQRDAGISTDVSGGFPFKGSTLIGAEGLSQLESALEQL